MGDRTNTVVSVDEAIRRARSDPEMADLVRDAYLDEDTLAAAKRFEESEEFAEVLSLLENNLTKSPPWDILDMGAGNGIAAYAFARAGHKVLALEPDPSSDVGVGAIKRLADSSGLNIRILESFAEDVPLSDECVDVIFVRQTLHHADDLKNFLKRPFAY